MSFKRDNPGSPCCECCPLYEFENSADMGKDTNLRFPVVPTSPLQSATGTQGKSAKFTGSSFYELKTAEGQAWPTRRSWCFTPSVVNQSFASKRVVKFGMKVVTEPTLPQTQAMGVLTRSTFAGNFPAGTFAGEWGVFYRHVETGATVFFVIKTDTTTNLLHQVAIDDTSGTGTNGFSEFVWTVQGSSSSVVVNSATYSATIQGTLQFGNDAFFIGNNTAGLKLAEGSGEILLDQISLRYE